MKISVVLTSYNSERFIEKSIDSILNQTYTNYELIIVDDCSTDLSWEKICKYKEKYPHIITVRHEYNWGSGIVADAVENYAVGEYIAINHCDDVWEKEKLQKQVEFIEKNPEYVAVFTNAVAIDEYGKIYDSKEGFYHNRFNVSNRTRHEWLNHFFYQGNCLCHPSVLIRKDVYSENNFFHKELRQIPDFVKWIQLCKKYEIYVLPEPLMKFRVRLGNKNSSGLRVDTQIRSTVELYLMLDEYKEITERDEFLKVFPEAKKYCNRQYFSTEYVLGRICTEKNMPVYTRLYGLQLLYKVLSNPEDAEMIKEQYGYTARMFQQDTGEEDIFGILPKRSKQVRSIYYDTGNGYNIEKAFTEQYDLINSDIFEMKCVIEVPRGKNIVALRFDPAEGIMVKVELEDIEINNEYVQFKAINALEIQDREEIFIDLDPIYEINLPQENLSNVNIKVRGKITRLGDEEVSSYIRSIVKKENCVEQKRQRFLLFRRK
ncbi:MAG: glycosyltransferase [Lachnospiraceae bacterium]|nr:glycosyltransferase [Lachnospiraceae bacterium]